MSIVNRLINLAIHGGSWVVRPYERAVIEAAANSLPDPDGRYLLLQLTFLDHLKRLHQDRMVTFYFESSKEGFPFLPRRSPDLSLANVSLRTTREMFSATVTAHRGLLFSLEFTKSPTYLRKEGFRIESVSISDVGPSILAQEIDQSEHGVDYSEGGTE